MTLKSPLRHVNFAALNEDAQAETRRREAALPPVSVFRWWARRTAAVNRRIVEAAAIDAGRRIRVADPFAGGGVIALSALAEGHRAYAQDIDPWAASGIHAMLTLPSEPTMAEAKAALLEAALPMLTQAYGDAQRSGAMVHTIRVARYECETCGTLNRLFPYAVVSRLRRREQEGTEAFLACRSGHLFLGSHASTQPCPDCDAPTDPSDQYLRGRVFDCNGCGQVRRLSDALSSNRSWEVVLVDRLVAGHRKLDFPTSDETRRADLFASGRHQLGEIPQGRETSVLHRHGFADWADLYPARQLAVTKRLLHLAAQVDGSESARRAMRLALVGSTEMAGYASRWDRWYLKSYEVTARHRFSFTTLSAEPHVWGVEGVGRGTLERRMMAFARARRWLEAEGIRSASVDFRSAEQPDDKRGFLRRDAVVVRGSSESILLGSGTVDLILTDPPYHDDIQYSELSTLFRCWAGMPIGMISRSAVATKSRDTRYELLLTRVLAECRRVLAPSGHLILSFANRDTAAWVALIRAADSAGFQACGVAVVHGENESNYAKNGFNHYTHNLVLDLVRADQNASQDSWIPTEDEPELAFLASVAGFAIKIGDLPPEWESDLAAELANSPYPKA